MAEKKRAVLYLRYSSSSQTEQSIEGQDRVCRTYAANNDLIIVNSYIDRAKSASHSVEKRLAFQQMVADSAKGLFDVVLVYKLDRFARDRYDSAIYKNRLKKNGVQVVSATEVISSGPEGAIMESLLEGFAEYYSLELSQKVKRGITESVAKRKFLGGNVPLGLMVHNNTLVPDPKSNFIIREIFELLDQGLTVTQVIDHLNSKGYRTAKGLPFKRTSLTWIVHNKRYIGYYIHRGQEIPGVIEPILDEELFWRVQRKLKNSKKCKRGKEDAYILSGKLFCGNCNSPMLGESGTSQNGNLYRYYKCFGAKKGSGCSQKALRKEKIELFIIEKAKELLTDEMIQKIALDVFTHVNETQTPSKIPALEERLRGIKKQLENGVTALLSGIPPEVLTEKLNALQKEKEALEISILEAKAEEVPITQEMITFYLEHIRDKTSEVYNSEKFLVDSFIEKIILEEVKEPNNNNQKIRIIFRLDDPNQMFENSFDWPANLNLFEPVIQVIVIGSRVFLLDTYDFPID